MSFDLAFWAGPRPADDQAADEEYDRRTAWFDDDDATPAPATPVIAAFLADLRRQFPALEDPERRDSPWSMTPGGAGDTDGDFIYLTLTYSGARRTYEQIVGTARRHGLVCYDPQLERLV